MVSVCPDKSEPTLETEGILWFTDLTIPDPYLILPLASMLINLAIIQVRNNHRCSRLTVVFGGIISAHLWPFQNKYNVLYML